MKSAVKLECRKMANHAKKTIYTCADAPSYV